MTFVKEILGISFAEAVQELVERARMTLPSELQEQLRQALRSSGDSPERDQAREKASLAHKLNRFVAAFYHQNLASDQQAAQYFKKRGVSSDWIRAFYLGVAPPAWESLAKYLVEAKAPLGLAEELGLIRASSGGSGRFESGSGYFDLFRNRVLFPVLNLRGKVEGFGGRSLGDDSPKYLNSSESFLFHKSQLLFGLYQAQKHIRERDEVIVVEGYFDALAMHAAGWPQTVATCGTALTREHLQILRRFCSRVVLLFDGDRAGETATQRAMEVGLEQGWVLHGAQLPQGADPDELLFEADTGVLLAGGQEQMRQLLQAAQPLLDSSLEESVARSLRSPEERTQAIKQMGVWLSRYQDPIGRQVRLQWVQQKMGVPLSLLKASVEQHSAVGGRRLVREVGLGLQLGGGQRVQVSRGRVGAERKVGLLSWEESLLSGLVASDWARVRFAEARERLPLSVHLEELFEAPSARQWIRSFLKFFENGEGLEDFLIHLEGLDEVLKSVVTGAALQPFTEKEKEVFQGALSKAISQVWARFSQQIKREISTATLGKDKDLQAKLMKEYLDVQRKMKDFSSFYDEA